MRRIVFFAVLCAAAVAVVFPLQEKKSANELPDRYKKWLEEEVVYIITPTEKEVFLKLDNDRERNLFIEAFWKHRDPEPKTPENEFRKEHYRRISYANNWFGRESPGPGWRTDRGRMYIILGEPKSVDRFENLSEVYPLVIWFYGDMSEYGLPNAFNVVFFKRRGVGEYELYSPIKFGPQKLLTNFRGDPTDYLEAYYELRSIEPAVAEVSLSMVPGETNYRLAPSLASELLLSSKIPSVPHRRVEDAYAENLLKYKDVIEVDYTANYIGNDSSAKVIRDSSGIFFVHFLIEPEKLSIEQLEDRFYTQLKVNTKISDTDGNMIFQYEKVVPIEFDEEQLNNIRAKLFSFQDMFPLVEGHYNFDVLLKNTASKEFTSIAGEVVIPLNPSFHMSSLVLANRLKKNSRYQGKNKPFLVGDVQLVPSPRNDFSVQDTLYVFFQVFGLDEELRANGILDYSLWKEDEEVRSWTRPIKEYPQGINFVEELSLSDFPPEMYRIQVSLLNQNSEEILSRESEFYISSRASLPRPWILSVPMPPSSHPMYANILGNQYLNKKDMQKAQSLLEKAYRKNPESVKFALDFAQAQFDSKNYKEAKQIALNFKDHQENHKFFQLIGRSCHMLEELQEAISYYKKYLAHYGTNLKVLNAIGECYYRMGNNEEALVAWEKSLEINPRQEGIKNMVKTIKDRKK